MIKLATELFMRNSKESAIECLRTIASYIDNLMKNPTEKKLRRVKITSAAFQTRVVDVEGGLALFLFGPAGYQWSHTDRTIQCSVQAIVGETGSSATRLWVQDMRMYNGYLHEVLRSM